MASSPRYRWLAAVPALGMLGGVPFVNRSEPLILGLPPLLAWIVAWVILTSVVMGIVFHFDSERGDENR
jgi:hypothetical protein